jgi:3-methyladenine DNA glycosylase/8-oxoguanine DNA glycosylase
LPGLPDEDDLRTLAGPWRPQRTLACMYLWESLELANAELTFRAKQPSEEAVGER